MFLQSLLAVAVTWSPVCSSYEAVCSVRCPPAEVIRFPHQIQGCGVKEQERVMRKARIEKKY